MAKKPTVGGAVMAYSNVNPMPMDGLVDKIKSVVSYNPDTGEFTRIKILSNRSKIGPTGIKTHLGYIVISIYGKLYQAHRVAWLLMNGPIPHGMHIDHINGDRSDNRIANLRLATIQQNNHNRRISVRNTTGLKGVQYRDEKHRNKKWKSTICVSGRIVHLGWFATSEEAHSAYVEAAKRYYGEFARTS